MRNVRMVSYVDQTIVQSILDFILNLIAVINQLLEMNIFVHLEYNVEKMKGIVTLTMNAKPTLSVIVVQHILDSHLMSIAVHSDDGTNRYRI